MAMYKDIALAVEGGGMRGAYSAGVLDVFLDNGIKFGACAGTSAGATHLCSYLSEQRERNKRLDTVHSASKRYMSWGNLIRTGDFFELDYCYNQIPRVVDPFDFEKFRENTAETKFYAVATNLETGGPEYLLTRDLDKPEDMDKIRASASLPLMSFRPLTPPLSPSSYFLFMTASARDPYATISEPGFLKGTSSSQQSLSKSSFAWTQSFCFSEPGLLSYPLYMMPVLALEMPRQTSLSFSSTMTSISRRMRFLAVKHPSRPAPITMTSVFTIFSALSA